MSSLKIHHYVSLGVFSMGLVVSQLTSKVPVSAIIASPPITLLKSSPIPVPKEGVNTASSTAFLQTLTARTVIAIDEDSAAVVLEKNSQLAAYPASTTKLMTALVARDIYVPTQVLEVREEAFTQGTTVGLEVGEHISVKNLLAGLLIYSGNDAAFTLANHHPEGYEGFVKAMNRKAIELNLEQTNFSNPSGLDQDQHRSSARDLALLTREVIKDELLRELMGTKTTEVHDESGEIKHHLINTHGLLGKEWGIVGGKTGTTPLAGEVLVSLVNKNGKKLIIVLMGSQNRYEETKQLMSWIDQHYMWIDPAELNTVELKDHS